MALTNAAQIGSDNSYQGNAGLGEVGGNPIVIDTRPLRELASYSFEYNRAEFNQKQREIEAQAKQLADMTAYDLTTAIPKDREEIQNGYNELFDYVRNDPTVLDYKNNQKGWMEYNKKKNDFENKLRGGKIRSMLYTSREKEVSDATTPELKSYLQKQLDSEVKATSIDTPLKHTQLFDLTPVTLTPPPSMKIDVTKVGANANINRVSELPDMASIKSQASAKALGILHSGVDENSPEFQAKSEEEKQLLRNQFQAQAAAGKLEPIESANNISSVLSNPKYKDPQFLNDDGTLNLDAVIKDNSGNALVSGVLSSIKQYNDRMDEMTGLINSGYFQDKLGNQLSFGDSGILKESDYSKINLSDGLTPEELLSARILGLAKPIVSTTKLTQTNQGIAQQNADTSRAKLNEIIRNNKAKLALQAQKLKDNADKWKATHGKESSTILKPAQLLGQHIDRLKKIFNNHPNATNEVVKYRAIDPYTKDALGLDGQTIINADGEEVKIDAINYKKDGSYELIDKGGKVLGLGTIENLAQGYINAANKSLTGSKSGVPEGFQVKSEAAMKDILGSSSGKDIWDNWAGGTTRVQGSITNESEDTIPQSYDVQGTKYSKDGLNKLGYTDEQIDQAIKLGNIKIEK